MFTQICPLVGLFPLSLCSVFSVFYYSLGFKVCFVRYEYYYPSFFFLSICMKYLHPFIFSLCIFFNQGGSLEDTTYVSLVFLSIQLPYVFWLKPLSHLHLRRLLIDMYLVPFLIDYFALFIFFLSLFLLLFKASPLIIVSVLVWC